MDNVMSLKERTAREFCRELDIPEWQWPRVADSTAVQLRMSPNAVNDLWGGCVATLSDPLRRVLEEAA